MKRKEISSAAIERMQELHDLGLNAVEISNATGFRDDVVRASLGIGSSTSTEKRQRKLMRLKMLADNPHHTPQTLDPIFRRLRQ